MELPNSARYVKLGSAGRWWKESKDRDQLHAGWNAIPDDFLQRTDYQRIKACLKDDAAKANRPNRVGREFEELRMLLDRPSQHVWITIENGYLWWCTVRDGIELNPDKDRESRGHFWLLVDQPWTNASLTGELLNHSSLPGYVTRTAAYRATVCGDKNERWQQAVLRIIRGEQDPEVSAAMHVGDAYCKAILKVVQKLQPEDFEELIEQILDRSGWLRLAKIGGTRADVDIEAENPAVDEIMFVQIKSTANQSVLDEYTAKFNLQRDRYDRMVFAVHTSKGKLTPPPSSPVQVWTGEKIAELVVRLGLGGWVRNRVR